MQVEFAGNCPAHICVTHWRFNAGGNFDHSARVYNDVEIEKRNAERKASAAENAARRREVADAKYEADKERRKAEKKLRDAISRRLRDEAKARKKPVIVIPEGYIWSHYAKGMSPTSICKYVNEGRLHGIKSGRRLYVNQAEVSELKEINRQKMLDCLNKGWTRKK